MEPKRILIVEDEVLIADSISRNLKKMGFQVVGIASDYDAALTLLSKKTSDLALIDIRLKTGKTGIDLAEHIQKHHKIPFIFLTSHLDTQTLTGAKHTMPSGYLTKPFHMESLYTTIEIALHNAKETTKDDASIFVKLGLHNEKILVKKILYLEADHVYVKIVTANKQYLSRQSLKEVMNDLPGEFVQVHRSFAINTDQITSLSATEVNIAGTTLPISRTYRNSLLEKVNAK